MRFHCAVSLGEPILRTLQRGRRCAGRRLHTQGKGRGFSSKHNSSVEPGGKCGHRIPARMKLWTNCRWNSKKAISSGALVISVAAVTIDQSIPWSVVAKTAKPTVRGRVVTELVMISGHRKLFQ